MCKFNAVNYGDSPVDRGYTSKRVEQKKYTRNFFSVRMEK